MDKINTKLFDKLSPFFVVVFNEKNDFYKDVIDNLNKYMEKEFKVFFFNEINSDVETYISVSDIFITNEINNDVRKFVKKQKPILIVDKISENFLFNLIEESPNNVAKLIALISKNRRLRRAIVEHQNEKFNEKPPIKFQIEGSFDSSYSLAIVNREVARALNKIFPGQVALYSTDGYGDFKPNKKFLDKNPDIKKMYQLSEKGMPAEVVLRNPYPPRVYDMKGLINGMTSYGWEESEYPKNYLEDFNRYLDFLPVMSPWVKKVMIDNGIDIPVFVVGLGVDHLKNKKLDKYPLKTKKRFKFLHISSCFPRKGVDVLIDAYTSTFTENDDVALIIKTFPNPHNNVEELIEYYQKKNKNFPEIELINKDISDEQISYLYTQADCFVLPSRGEGFGMPAAEAMLYKVPVITTAYSGQTYFCNPETALLVDFKFEKSKSHLSSFYSYWANPSKNDLSKKMKFVYENKDSKEIKEKVEKAYKLITENFTWNNVAKRLIQALEKTKKQPIFIEKNIKVAFITSYNTKCGIASYTRHLIENLEDCIQPVIIANRVSKNEILDEEIEKNVNRLWEIGTFRFEDVLNYLKENNIDNVFVQHHFAFFDTKKFGKFIDSLYKNGINIFITFHTTQIKEKSMSLKHISNSLKKAKRLFVHSIKDLNILKDMGLIENVSLLPHGIAPKDYDISIRESLKKTYKLEDKTVIGTFGFLRRHKGTLELIKAFELIKGQYPDLKLLLLNSIYPSPDSAQFFDEVKEYIKSLPKDIRKDIIFITDYIPEESVPDYLSLMDIIIFPYHDVDESSSAAVRYAISLKKPVITTPYKIFEDVEEIAIKAKSHHPEALAEAIKNALENPEMLKEKIDRINEFLSLFSWKEIGKRTSRIIKSIVLFDS